MICQIQDNANIFLIGYRCTGKSSVGRLLAARLGRGFVDTDRRLVANQGADIFEIVHQRGWQGFRRLEHITIKQVCKAKRQIVATGGGIVLQADNVALMKKNGFVIWLKATADAIKTRMMRDQTSEDFRPALTTTDRISEIGAMLAERHPLYRTAMDFAVDTDGRRVDEVCEVILAKLEQMGYI